MGNIDTILIKEKYLDNFYLSHMPVLDEFSVRSARFVDWLKSNGAVISNKIEVCDYREAGQGRGIRATAGIDEDELLFSIPRSLVISVENNTSAVADFLQSKNASDLSEWSKLIVAMLLSQNSDAYKPYFEILPKTFDTLMFWSQNELYSLKGSYVVEKIGREEAELEYNSNIRPLFENSNVDCSLEAYHRMGSLIMAYSFDIPPRETVLNEEDGEDSYIEDDEENGFIKAMIPLADTLNAHTKLCNARLFPSEDGETLEMRSIKPIGEHEQIYNSYGELPNSDLLRRYGYCEPGGNDFDVVEVKTPDLLATMKANLQLSDESVRKFLKYLTKLDEEDDVLLLDEESFDIPNSGEPDIETLMAMILLYLSSLVPDVKLSQIFKVLDQIAQTSQTMLTPEIAALWQSLIFQRSQQYGEPSGNSIRSQYSREIISKEKQILQRSLDWSKNSEVIPGDQLVSLIKSKKRQTHESVSQNKKSKK